MPIILLATKVISSTVLSCKLGTSLAIEYSTPKFRVKGNHTYLVSHSAAKQKKNMLFNHVLQLKQKKTFYIYTCILRGKRLEFLKAYQGLYIYLCHFTWVSYTILIIRFNYFRPKPIKSIQLWASFLIYI